MSKKTFCTYPWQHMYVGTTGHFKICCLSNEHVTKDDGYKQFNLKNDKLSDSWNSKYMAETRKKMLAGEKLTSCKRCYDQEDKGLESMRCTDDYEQYALSTVDGKVDTPINHVELHFGNVCNLACKMCSQQYSHKIGQELLKIGEQDKDFVKWIKTEGGVVNNWTAELGLVYDWFKNVDTKKDIFEYVSKHVDGLNIVGGEPTSVKEFYELIDYLDKQDTLKDKNLCLTTNMTNVSDKMMAWFSKAKKVTIYGSLDGVGDVNEYIRFPSQWSVIEKSLNAYCDLVKQERLDKLVIGPAFQALNIHNLIDMIEYVENIEDSKKISVEVWWTGLVVAPLICDYLNMPDEYKKKVAGRLEANLHRIKNTNSKTQIETHISLLRQSNDHSVPYKNKILQSFVKYNDAHDKHRGHKTWRELIPDLEKSIESYLNTPQV
jgi:hypothetical protein